MARLSLPGARMKTDQDDARLRDALRDLDHWRDRANAAEQDAEDERERLRLQTAELTIAYGALEAAEIEVKRLKHALQVFEATALPRLSAEPLVSTGTIGPLIAEALDMEIGGEK